MGKIFHLMGKSASGKDTLFKRLLEQGDLNLQTIIPYTTRPQREGEQNGVAYHFTKEADMWQLQEAGKIIEMRCYHTVHGDWYYFTVDDGQIDLHHKNYLVIGTLETYDKMQQYFGKEQLVPLYIHLDSGERLQRALQRERLQKEPKYKELCRRFLADEEDFSEEKLSQLEITHCYENQDLEVCMKELRSTIQASL